MLSIFTHSIALFLDDTFILAKGRKRGAADTFTHSIALFLDDTFILAKGREELL
jgi:hypothetical protein